MNYNYIDEEAQIFKDNELSAKKYPPEKDKTEDEVFHEPPDPPPRRDPGLDALGLTATKHIDGACEEEDIEMTEPPGQPAPDDPAAGTGNPSASGDDENSLMETGQHTAANNANELQEKATLALLSREASTESGPPPRIDSARESREKVPQLPAEDNTQASDGAPPLTIQTVPRPAAGNASSSAADESIMSSPILRKQMIQVEGNTANTLPAVQQVASPQQEEASTSHRKESLPGFQQLAHLAEAATQQATQQEVRGPPSSGHHQSPSIGSVLQSPMQPFPPYSANSSHTSPTSITWSATSPTSTSPMGDGHPYPSPHRQSLQAYYSYRRSSTATDTSRQFPPHIPSLPSQSSSGDSYATASSSTDGYSTSHTTPIEHTDASRTLPPPPGMSVIPAGGFKCDYDGCNAPSFQTQYLLSSHRNVHSQNRPHYCLVEGCPRSEGGKGFKRKNEMIRHGLVHNSPGYVCPFCPDREHRYPRPDNLQRHVRVHHPDRDRNDPSLRDVLAQRQEGTTQKQRRRRTQSTTDLLPPREGEPSAPAVPAEQMQ